MFTYWTNYCNGLYSAASYMQLCQQSIYYLAVGNCVYSESETVLFRQINHLGGGGARG